MMDFQRKIYNQIIDGLRRSSKMLFIMPRNAGKTTLKKELAKKTDCELYDHIPVPYDGAFWHCKVCGIELVFISEKVLFDLTKNDD